jgi:hypothetical protein
MQQFKFLQNLNDRASNAEWRTFFESQPLCYPDFFKTPNSLASQEYFKSLLELIAKRSIKSDNIPGLWAFLRSVNNENVRELMWTWLNKYTPIREKVSKNGNKQIVIVSEYREKCSLIEGMEHPYFSLKPQPRKHFQGRDSKPITDNKQEPKIKSTAPARTELEFQKKVARLSFNKFLADRSVENRHELIDAIHSIPLGPGGKKGNPFFQGGAVGSKR